MSSRKLFYMTTVCTFLLSFNHATAETIVCPGGNCNNNTVSSLGGDASQMDVNEGGTANGNEVSNGGVMNVNKGGVANGTSVRTDFWTGGTVNVNDGGTLNDTNISAGTINAGAGSTVSGTNMDGGELNAAAGSNVSKTQVNSDGIMNVEAGATVNTVAINDGTLNLKDGATVSNVASGGHISAGKDVVIDGLFMSERGSFDFSTDMTIKNGKYEKDYGETQEKTFSIENNKADGFIINGGSSFTVTENGSLSNSVVKGPDDGYGSGGKLISVDKNTSIDNVTIEEGGRFEISTDTTVSNSTNNGQNISIKDHVADGFVLDNGQSLIVRGDGTANGTVVNQGKLTAESGAKLNDTTVNGSLDIVDGVTADNTNINAGGSLNVSGGSLNNTTVAGEGKLTADGGKFDGLTMEEGSRFDLTTDVEIADGKQQSADGENAFSIADKKAEGLHVTDGNKFTVKGDGAAENTLVESGGSLTVRYKTELTDLTAEKDSILDINKDVVMKGDILIDRQAVMGGSFDYNSIFTSENISSLTVSNGINDIFKDTLINNAKGKNLVFKDGKYDITGGAAEEGSSLATVSGWNNIGIEGSENRQAAVSLFGDLAYDGTLNIGRFGTLDFAQNNLKLSGDVENEGVLSLTNGKESGRRATVAGDYTAKSGALLHVNVDSEKEVSDVLKIDGDVKGSTGVVAHVVSEDVKPENKILFVEASNDDASTAADFSIYRVYGSAYNWGTVHENNNWYLNGNSDEVTGEVVAYAGLPSAAFEQTRNVVGNVFAKAANDKDNCGNCGLYDHAWDGKKLSNLWVVPGYHSAKVDSPFEFDADIYGLEAGYDVQLNPYHKLGLFVSYRQGEYDFSGKGDDYYAKTGGSIDIDSYLAGLYHRYDTQIKGRSAWLMSSLYGGWQKADLKSDDGVKADTDGLEYGAALEAGVVFMPATDVMVEPTVGVRYVHIDFDTVRDGLGKTARYDDVSETELEFGVKAEKTFEYGDGYAKLFVKPSVVQTFGDGDVRITSLGSVSGLEDMTLGRVIVGGSMDFTKQLNGFADVGYTFGGDYRDLNFNLGVNYAF